MTDLRLRVGVVGVGHLGRHHARLLAANAEAELVGVVDLRPERARETALACGTQAIETAERLAGLVEAVTIAVPTAAHLEVALPFLERGVSVLVEKPMTRTLDEAERLIEAADRSGAVLAVGHTERYNPAVAAARPLVTTPRFIEVHRLASFAERSLDIDVIFDLMIHDLDIVLTLVGSDATGVEAVGVPVLSDRLDIANARLRFGSGCIANLTASRISRDRVRKLRFFQPDSYISIDYASQEVEAWRLERHGPAAAIKGGKLEVTTGEPLALELADFVGAVRERRAPAVTGRQGLRALALAQRISTAVERV